MHSRLEAYLQTVEVNLHALPVEERQNELHELRLHMESLLESYQELGSTEEEAVTQTLAQFGRANTLGKDLNQAHQSAGRSSIDTLAGAVAFNYLSGMAASLVISRLFILALPASGAPTAIWVVRGLLLTLCIGGMTGALMPRNAVKGTLYAHLAATGLSWLVMLCLPTHALPVSSHPVFWIGQIINTLIGTAIAMGGAKLGASWRDRQSRKMRIAL